MAEFFSPGFFVPESDNISVVPAPSGGGAIRIAHDADELFPVRLAGDHFGLVADEAAFRAGLAAEYPAYHVFDVAGAADITNGELRLQSPSSDNSAVCDFELEFAPVQKKWSRALVRGTFVGMNESTPTQFYDNIFLPQKDLAYTWFGYCAFNPSLNSWRNIFTPSPDDAVASAGARIIDTRRSVVMLEEVVGDDVRCCLWCNGNLVRDETKVGGGVSISSYEFYPTVSGSSGSPVGGNSRYFRLHECVNGDLYPEPYIGLEVVP